MKIVIDIPEEQYEIIKECAKNQDNFCSEVDSAEKIISRGIPLPKNHGRFIDADMLKNDMQAKSEWYGDIFIDVIGRVIDVIDNAPTIIESDKAESEEE